MRMVIIIMTIAIGILVLIHFIIDDFICFIIEVKKDFIIEIEINK